MNKPLPWNVKGVGFDAREAARLAAKRAGVPLGEWLNGIIASRAAELGVQVEDVEAEDRLEAIASRLSTQENAQPPRHQVAERQPVDVRRDAAPVRSLADEMALAAEVKPARAVAASPSLAEGTFGQAKPIGAQFAQAAALRGVASSAAAPSRVTERRRGGALPQPVAAVAGQVEADQLDERLNTILAKLNRSFEAAAEIGDTLGGRDTVRRRADVAVSSSEPPSRTGVKAMAPAEAAAATHAAVFPVADAAPKPTSFADLNQAFVSLSEKLEAQLAEAQGQRARPASGARTEPGRRAEAAAASRALEDKARVEQIKALQRDLAQLSASVAELAPQRSLASLETAVRELAGRIDLSRLDGVQASVLAPVERLGQDMREAIRSTDATAAVEAVRRDMKALASKLEAQPARGADDRALDGMRGELRGLREMVGTLAERLSASERLGDEIAALGERVGTIAERATPAVSRDLAHAIEDIRGLLQAFEPHAGLGAIDKKIDHLSARVESIAGRRNPDVDFAGMMQQIDRAHEALMDRLAGRGMAQPDLSGIEESLGTLSAKIDTMGRASHDVNALYGLVGNLADRMQEARDPQAEAPALSALQTQIAQLVERLDRTEADHGSLHGLERLIGDLFLQIEQSRNAAIDAAENAARAAAQDTLRAAMDNPTLNGAELTVQTGLDVDHVSQELAELRRIQEASDRRITGTLTALNTTLERLVDHMVSPMSPAPVAHPVEEPAPANRAQRRRRLATEPREPAIASDLPPFDPEQFLIEPGSLDAAESREPRAGRAGQAGSAAPIPQVGTDPNASVAPLIAAARRAAQAAQESALEASLRPMAETAGPASAGAQGKARSFFASNRRPLLLALAGVVLLLGTLQIVRLSTQPAETGTVATPPTVDSPSAPDAAPTPLPKTDKGASLTGAPNTPSSPARSALLDPAPTGSVPPASLPASDAPAKAVPGGDTAALTGMGQGLRDLAAGGNAAAQFEVATRLADGKGVTRDPKASAAWFERAAKQNLAPAQYRLGSAYEKGIGVAADPALAVAWYEKAAQQGNIRAMHNLAVMSAEGAGSKPDYGKAVSWFTKAASYGVRDSQYNLAVLFARGLGVPQNLGQSYAWFALAAQQGDTDAVAKRDTVAAKLDAKALADAKSMVASFHPLTTDPAANDVPPPPGGWDAAAPAKTASTRKVEARISAM